MIKNMGRNDVGMGHAIFIALIYGHPIFPTTHSTPRYLFIIIIIYHIINLLHHPLSLSRSRLMVWMFKNLFPFSSSGVMEHVLMTIIICNDCHHSSVASNVSKIW